MDDSAANPLPAAIVGHYEELTAFVRRMVRCPALAADIVQETYVRLASGSTSAAIENPRALLYRVAGNLAIDHLRQERTRAKYVTTKPLDGDVPDTQPSAERAIEAKQRLAVLIEIVNELPPRCRQIFILRKFHGLDQAEIAKMLGISRNMVEKHLRNALLKCTLRLKGHF